jgi:hypothetical protein
MQNPSDYSAKALVASSDDDASSSLFLIGRSYKSADAAQPPTGGVRRGFVGDADGASGGIVGNDIAVAKLKANFVRTLAALHQTFDSALTDSFGALKLESFDVNLEITADGKVGVLGMGVGLSGTTGLKLTFQRPKES